MDQLESLMAQTNKKSLANGKTSCNFFSNSTSHFQFKKSKLFTEMVYAINGQWYKTYFDIITSLSA
jgi:hypothetical protein